MSTNPIDILETLSIDFSELDEIFQVLAKVLEELDHIESNSSHLYRFNLL
jgi:hypothetical protein